MPGHEVNVWIEISTCLVWKILIGATPAVGVAEFEADGANDRITSDPVGATLDGVAVGSKDGVPCVGITVGGVDGVADPFDDGATEGFMVGLLNTNIIVEVVA